MVLLGRSGIPSVPGPLFLTRSHICAPLDTRVISDYTVLCRDMQAYATLYFRTDYLGLINITFSFFMFVFSVGIGLQWQSTNISISWNPSPQLIMFVGFSKSLYTVIQICSFFEMQLYLICYTWGFWVTCISKELNFQWFCSLLVNFPYIAYFFFVICVKIFLLILFYIKKSMAVIVERLTDKSYGAFIACLEL